MTRLYHYARSSTYVVGATILLAAGIGTSPAGWSVIGWYAAMVAWSVVRSIRSPARRVGLPMIAADVLCPSVTGMLVGHDPYSLHLLVAAQISGTFLVASPRTARLVGSIAAGGLITGLAVAAGTRSPITLTPGGYRIAEVGAVMMGLGLGLAIISLVGHRMWETRTRLATAADAERRHAETLRRFVAMVNHELRSPLTTICGFTDVLTASRHDLSENEIDEFLSAIGEQSGQLARLVDDILVALRLEVGRLPISRQALDLEAVVSNVTETTTLREGQSMTIDIPDRTTVLADRDRVCQVVRNLMENAVKYGGPNIRIDAHRVDGRVRTSISDDGPGIPADLVDEVFSEYRQLGTDGSGFGLGLPIVRRLMEAMQGGIEYDPDGTGVATFVLDLPAADRVAPPSLDGV